MWRPERAQATVAEATLVLPFSLKATESSSAVAKLSTLLTLGNEALNHREATLEKPLFFKKNVSAKTMEINLPVSPYLCHHLRADI